MSFPGPGRVPRLRARRPRGDAPWDGEASFVDQERNSGDGQVLLSARRRAGPGRCGGNGEGGRARRGRRLRGTARHERSDRTRARHDDARRHDHLRRNHRHDPRPRHARLDAPRRGRSDSGRGRNGPRDAHDRFAKPPARTLRRPKPPGTRPSFSPAMPC